MGLDREGVWRGMGPSLGTGTGLGLSMGLETGK